MSKICLRARTVLVLSFLLVGACAEQQKSVSLAPPRRSLEAKDYERELKRWTRFSSYLKQLDTTVRVYATLRGPAFDAALIAKKKTLFALDPARVAKLEAEAQKRASETLSLVMIAATHDYLWNDFDRKRSHWRTFLENDAGDQLDPIAIKRKRRVTETDRALFPHLQTFYVRYDIDFPRTLPDGRPFVRDGVKEIMLRVSGPLGKAELRWRLR